MGLEVAEPSQPQHAGCRRADGACQNDAALEDIVFLQLAVYRLQECNRAEAPQGLKGDVHNNVVDEALQQANLHEQTLKGCQAAVAN